MYLKMPDISLATPSASRRCHVLGNSNCINAECLTCLSCFLRWTRVFEGVTTARSQPTHQSIDISVQIAGKRLAHRGKDRLTNKWNYSKHSLSQSISRISFSAWLLLNGFSFFFPFLWWPVHFSFNTFNCVAVQFDRATREWMYDYELNEWMWTMTCFICIAIKFTYGK